MDIMGMCILTDDVMKLSAFYRDVLCAEAEGDDIHSQFEINGIRLALYNKAAAQKDMHFDFKEYNGSGNTVLMFRVDDVDKEFDRLKKIIKEFVTIPTTYPWGARSFQFRDPDGNIIDFVTPPK